MGQSMAETRSETSSDRLIVFMTPALVFFRWWVVHISHYVHIPKPPSLLPTLRGLPVYSKKHTDIVYSIGYLHSVQRPVHQSTHMQPSRKYTLNT